MYASSNYKEEIRNMYMSLHPVIPEEMLTELVTHTSESIKDIFTDKLGFNKDVTLVFGCSSLETDAKRGTLSSCNDREFVFINLLKVEFFRDYLIYKSFGDEKAFQWFFCKYMRNVEYNSNNMEAAAFYNYLYSCACKEREYADKPLLEMMFTDILFLLLHEWSHDQKDRLEDTCFFMEKLIKENELPEMSKEIVTEAACDYIALNYLVRHDVPLFELTRIDAYNLGFLVVLLLHFYNYFPEVTESAIISGDSSIEEVIDTLAGQLQTRILILAVALSVSDFVETDLPETYIDELFSGINDFETVFFHMLSFIKETRSSALTVFQRLSEEDKKHYIMEESKEAWVFCV